MTDADTSHGPLKDLTTSRSRFIAELGERLTALRQGLARLASPAEPASELNAVRRRLHALAAAAEVLRFTPAAQALAVAEAALSGAQTTAPGAPARERVSRILDLLPSLVLGVAVDLGEELDLAPTRLLREPLCVVVYGDALLESQLHRPGPLHGAESHSTRDAEQLFELCAQLSPDVLLVDGDDPKLADLVPRLRQSFGALQVPIVAVGSFDRHEPMLRLVRRGITRILPKPVESNALQRLIAQTGARDVIAPLRPASFRRLTPDELVHGIANEARRAFGSAASGSRAAAAIDFGSGSEVLAALWSAFARIRALAVEASEGVTPFPLEGPNGAIPLAPAPMRTTNPAVEAARGALAGLSVVVVDDDAAIVQLLSGALDQLGMRVLPAHTGAHALDLAERHWPDAIISDTLMPGLDGFELCRCVREDLALADLPVALLSWKDYLLERVRPGLDGTRSVPSLDPDTLAQALHACLLPRLELERRLTDQAELHGRLDGLTPRLLLQLVCRRAPNAVLHVHSGRLKFEVHVADGRPLHARVYQDDAPRAEGTAVLGALLGARIGRFSVQRAFSSRPAHFDGDLLAVLDGVVQRARRVRARLLRSGLEGIDQSVLDPIAVTQYLTDSGGTNRALISQLLEGTPLQKLAASRGGELTDSARLTTTLLELARRGAVVGLLDRQGRDLLSPEAMAALEPVPTRANRASIPPPEPLPTRSTRASVPPPEPVAARSSRASVPPPEPDATRANRASIPPPEPDATRANRASIPPPEPVAARSTRASVPPPSAGSFSLGEAVLHAVSEPARSSVAPSDVAASEAAASEAAPRARSSRPPEPAFSRSSSTDLSAEGEPSPDPVGRPASDPLAAVATDDSYDDDRFDEDAPWPTTRGARLRAAAIPCLVTLCAAGLAFVGIRSLTNSGWHAFQGLPPGRAEAVVVDAPLPAATLAPTPSATTATTATTATPEATATDPAPPTPAAPTLADAPKAALGADSVEFAIELLELPPHTKLRAGHGLLEIRTWEAQQMYVDGVFMGNYQNRLIPINPGTYQLRLRAGARDLERSVEVKAGRRTRLVVRPKDAQ